MKFIALVSGGKDSCFNILHCLNAGHELVAMANLRPRAGRPDEIDSYMYQTVGHQAVESLSRCCDVPLFRASISENEEDVIAELAALFADIKARGVEFSGVSVGAIGSTYQQLRVDRACAALGLRSLAFLWQRPQPELLREICDSGLDVRVIKVAGMGLGQQHLGRRLRDIRDELLELHRATGLHPCGEGGEYETMVFDAPFFKQRLQIINERVVQHSTDDVYYLDFGVEVVPKQGSGSGSGSSMVVPLPSLIEDRFVKAAETAASAGAGISAGGQAPNAAAVVEAAAAAAAAPSVRCFTVNNFADLAAFFTRVPIEACHHVAVTVADMRTFGAMNEQYVAVFQSAPGRTPGFVDPSRACIESAGLRGGDVEITVFYTLPVERGGRGVHVQGLSYWAPASIGPYSQCRLVNGVSFVAGQIHLVPQTLELFDGAPQLCAALALQNACRVLDAVHETAGNWVPRLCVLYYTEPGTFGLAHTLFRALFPSLPLVGCRVSALPRGARFEWSIQACDVRYFSYYVPETEEEDEMYSERPEMLSCSKTMYTFRSGFQVLSVTSGDGDQHNEHERKKQAHDFKLKLTTVADHHGGDDLAAGGSERGHVVPVRQLHLNDAEPTSLYINY